MHLLVECWLAPSWRRSGSSEYHCTASTRSPIAAEVDLERAPAAHFVEDEVARRQVIREGEPDPLTTMRREAARLAVEEHDAERRVAGEARRRLHACGDD